MIAVLELAGRAFQIDWLQDKSSAALSRVHFMSGGLSFFQDLHNCFHLDRVLQLLVEVVASLEGGVEVVVHPTRYFVFYFLIKIFKGSTFTITLLGRTSG